MKWSQNSSPHTRQICRPSFVWFIDLSLVHKTQFCMKSYFHQNKSGDTSGSNAPRSQLNPYQKNEIFSFWNGQNKFSFPLCFWYQSVGFFNSFFNGLLMLSFVPFTFFLTIILYSVAPKKIACLLKGKIEGKKFLKTEGKKVEGILRPTFVWVACYGNCLCSKVHFLWKESKN